MAFQKNPNLVYPELSYQIMRCAFNVHNTLGGGLPEKDYQQALAREFKLQGITYSEQCYVEIEYKGKTLKRFCDFLVDEKILIEIKSVSRIVYRDFQQAERYLVFKKLKLALLILFGREFVSHKRILNINKDN